MPATRRRLRSTCIGASKLIQRGNRRLTTETAMRVTVTRNKLVCDATFAAFKGDEEDSSHA